MVGISNMTPAFGFTDILTPPKGGTKGSSKQACWETSKIMLYIKIKSMVMIVFLFWSEGFKVN